MYNILGYSLVICSFYDAFQPLGLHGRLPGWADGQGEDEEDVQHHHAQGENTVMHVFIMISFFRMSRVIQKQR